MNKLVEKIQHYGLEFVTIFFGVTLSLLADNWRQQRSDLSAEHDSMVQMYNDLGNEVNDMQRNMGVAQNGLQSAHLLIQGVHGHGVDSVSAALTGLGQCSFFVPYQSEYTAMKSSGRLSVIEDPTLRQNIVDFYEVDPFVQWLQERDCTLTGELMDSMVGKLEFAEWPVNPRDSARFSGANGNGRPNGGNFQPNGGNAALNSSAPQQGQQAQGPPGNVASDSASGRRGGRGGFRRESRYPRVIYKPEQEKVLGDPALRDRIVRLAVQRNYLINELQGRITSAQNLRDSMRVQLGSDTFAIRGQRRQQRPAVRGGNTRGP